VNIVINININIILINMVVVVVVVKDIHLTATGCRSHSGSIIAIALHNTTANSTTTKYTSISFHVRLCRRAHCQQLTLTSTQRFSVKPWLSSENSF
jgi:hypothetical protein